MGAFTFRYADTINGAITFVGNTVGLSKEESSNDAGKEHSIGAYIRPFPDQDYDDYATNSSDPTNNESGSTLYIYDDATATPPEYGNGSFTDLNLPDGSEIKYVDLVWGGSYISGAENNTALIGNPVRVTVDSGTTVSISPEITYTIAGNPAYYMNVTKITNVNWPELMALTGGTHKITCENVVGTTNPNDETNNACGWTLCVAYYNPTLPSRNLSLYSGNTTTFVGSGNTVSSTITGFQTPVSGQVNGRILFTACEGDAVLTGDQAAITDSDGNPHYLAGPRNPINNFFCSQINGDSGFTDTSGSFGEYNQDPISGTNIDGGRQGWDVTNVDANPIPYVNLDNNQTSTTVICSSSGDRYWVTEVGIQLDVNAPTIEASKMAIPATVVVNDLIEYTIILKNSGTAVAKNVVITDVLPGDTIYEPNTLSVSVPATITAFPPTISLTNQIPIGGQVVIKYKARVTGIPTTRTFVNFAGVEYYFDTPDGIKKGNAVTNNVTTSISAPLPPFAPNYTAETCKGGTVSGTVQAMSINRNYPMDYFIMVPPSNGFASIDHVTGKWTYTPEAGFTGIDSFIVTFIDSVGIASISTITITVLDILCSEYECKKCSCKCNCSN